MWTPLLQILGVLALFFLLCTAGLGAHLLMYRLRKHALTRRAHQLGYVYARPETWHRLESRELPWLADTPLLLAPGGRQPVAHPIKGQLDRSPFLMYERVVNESDSETYCASILVSGRQLRPGITVHRRKALFGWPTGPGGRPHLRFAGLPRNVELTAEDPAYLNRLLTVDTCEYLFDRAPLTLRTVEFTGAWLLLEVKGRLTPGTMQPLVSMARELIARAPAQTEQ